MGHEAAASPWRGQMHDLDTATLWREDILRYQSGVGVLGVQALALFLRHHFGPPPPPPLELQLPGGASATAGGAIMANREVRSGGHDAGDVVLLLMYGHVVVLVVLTWYCTR